MAKRSTRSSAILLLLLIAGSSMYATWRVGLTWVPFYPEPDPAITGKIFGDGKPLAAEIAVYPRLGSRRQALTTPVLTVQTDPRDGSFYIPQPSNWPFYLLQVSAPGYMTEERDVSISQDSYPVEHLEVNLKPGEDKPNDDLNSSRNVREEKPKSGL